MGSNPNDTKELLKALDCFLGRDGEVKSIEGITKIFNLMKDSQKMVSRCIYLNILLHTRSQDILIKFIHLGGYELLNTWLTAAKATNNVPFLQQILLTLQHLPLTVDHLKQNNTAKLVKQLSKSSDDEELRCLASILVSDWMAVIHSQSGPQPSEKDEKKREEENKPKNPIPETNQEFKSDLNNEDGMEKKREKPKSLRATAPSHAKFPSTGLEMEAPSLTPSKKTSSSSAADKYIPEPVPIKRQNTSSLCGENPPAEKKYKPLNTTPNATKEIEVKVIPPQRLSFLDALNSAPIPGIKIKKKKRVLSPTAAKPSPFEGTSGSESSAAKPSLPEANGGSDGMETDRPGTPVPAVEVPEPMEGSSEQSDGKQNEGGGDGAPPSKKGRKRKSVSWPEESKLREYFYFELDETERVDVSTIRSFGEAAEREMLKGREAFETARRLSHGAMEEKVPWVRPQILELPAPLVVPGSSSRERFAQAEREKGILRELLLSKERVPDSPHRPDPESYEPLPPKLIPLDEHCSPDDPPYPEVPDAAPPPSPNATKLPPVLANLMGSVGGGAAKSPQAGGGAGNPGGPPPPINMQEILSSIMGGPYRHEAEELLKQPEITVLLGSLQGQQGVPHGLLGPGPMASGFPPGPRPMGHFAPGGPGPMPGPHGGPPGPSLPPMPGGPRLMGPGGGLGPGYEGPVGAPTPPPPPPLFLPRWRGGWGWARTRWGPPPRHLFQPLEPPPGPWGRGPDWRRPPMGL